MWLGAGLSSGWGLDGGQQVGAHIGSDVEDGVYGEGEYGKGDLAREEPDESHDCQIVSTCYVGGKGYAQPCRRLTQVLNVLIGSKSDDTALLSGPHAGAVGLVDYDAVCDACRQEGSAVREGGPSRGVVEGDVGQAVSQSSEQQGNVSGEPSKLESLGKGSKALAQRHGGRRWGCHCVYFGNCRVGYVIGSLQRQ